MEGLNFINENILKPIPEYNQTQENLLSVYRRENDSLKIMIHHYEATLKCRETMVSQYISELQELKKTVQHQKKIISALNLEIDSFKNEKFFKKIPIVQDNSSKKLRPINSPKYIKDEYLYIKKPNIQTVTKSQGIGLSTASFFQENDKFSTLFTAGFQKKVTKQRYRKIEELTKCKGDFFTAFNALNFSDREEIVESSVSCFHELMSYSKVNYKLRGVINLYRNITKLSNLEDMIIMINKEIPFLFNCYKSHLYLLDEYANELWTPLDEADNYIKLSLDVKDNAVVYTMMHDKIVRIDSAQNDLNFSRNLDNEKNIKIKNMLCYPIKNMEEKIFAVIELVNKHEGIFGNEDEDFLNLITNQIGSLILQFMESERSSLKFTKITTLINLVFDLQKCEHLNDFLLRSEEKINELMGTELCSVVYVDHKNNRFVKIFKNVRKTVSDLRMGIVGKSFTNDIVIQTKNSKNDPLFNKGIDLETELPMITFPVKYCEKILGIVQMIHLRKKIGEKFLKKSFFWEKEFLNYFSGLLGMSFQKINPILE